MPHVSSKKSSGVCLREYAVTPLDIGERILIRVLPVSPFSPCDALGISRYPHPEGEPCIYIPVQYRRRPLH